MIGKAWLIAILIGLVFYAGLFRAFAQVDAGGNIMAYYAEHNPSPITGFCASACTIRLRDAACVSRSAVLGFHRATTEIGTRIMAGTYRPKLRAWFDANATRAPIYLQGRALARFGYQVCP